MPTPLVNPTTGRARPVAREVRTFLGREAAELVVTLTPEGIVLRRKRTRTGYLLPYGPAFQRAAALVAEKTVAEKRSKRRGARRGLLAVGGR